MHHLHIWINPKNTFQSSQWWKTWPRLQFDVKHAMLDSCNMMWLLPFMYMLNIRWISIIVFRNLSFYMRLYSKQFDSYVDALLFGVIAIAIVIDIRKHPLSNVFVVCHTIQWRITTAHKIFNLSFKNQQKKHTTSQPIRVPPKEHVHTLILNNLWWLVYLINRFLSSEIKSCLVICFVCHLKFPMIESMVMLKLPIKPVQKTNATLWPPAKIHVRTITFDKFWCHHTEFMLIWSETGETATWMWKYIKIALNWIFQFLWWMMT